VRLRDLVQMVAVVAVVGWLCPGVALAVTGSVSRSPDAIAYFGAGDPRTTRKVVHTLTLVGGTLPERYLFDVDGAPDVQADGASRLIVVAAASSVMLSSRPPGRDGCPAESGAGESRVYRLDVPAGATVTVTIIQALALERAPTDPRAFEQRWSLRPVDEQLRPTAEDVAFSEHPVTLTGLRPAALTLRVGRTGSGRAIGARQTLAVLPGTDLTLSGSLSPDIRGERVTVYAYGPRATRPWPVGVARADRHGRFLLRHWRPRRRGPYELFARYTGRAGEIEATRSSCSGPRVTVG